MGHGRLVSFGVALFSPKPYFSGGRHSVNNGEANGRLDDCLRFGGPHHLHCGHHFNDSLSAKIIRMTSLEALKQYWGYSAFREPQEKIIEAVLNQEDAVAVLPTGGGIPR